MARILIVDDFTPFLRVVRLILQIGDNLQIVGEASDGLEAVQNAKILQPNVVLLDIDLPTLNVLGHQKVVRTFVAFFS